MSSAMTTILAVELTYFSMSLSTLVPGSSLKPSPV